MPDDLKRIHIVADTVPLAFTDVGAGTPVLLLHGGAGPASMRGLAATLCETHRVIAPIHPGFDGEPRPDWFHTVGELATGYLVVIEQLDLTNVVIVGNSVGGWIAAEMALRRSSRVAGIVLLNAVGIDADPEGASIVDPMAVPPAERAARAFHDPARFAVMLPTPEAMDQLASNQRALLIYAGEPFMHDPNLRGRLANLDIPTLVVWGTSDRIVDHHYGRRLADSIPGARFVPIAEAGHFPQIEKTEAVRELIEDFIAQCRSIGTE